MIQATKGAILKRRIKEMGYTQERFSEETGVPYSTLKKYLANKCPYDIDLLERFAEKLECSYDYLMGYSVSPDRELQSVKDVTRLSDTAIKNLQEHARGYDTSEYERYNIDTASIILESDGLVDAIAQYLKPTKEIEIVYQILQNQMKENDYDLKIPLDSGLMISVINEINLLKYK